MIRDIIGTIIKQTDYVAQAQGKRNPDLLVAQVTKVDCETGYVRTDKGLCKTPHEKLLVIKRGYRADVHGHLLEEMGNI